MICWGHAASVFISKFNKTTTNLYSLFYLRLSFLLLFLLLVQKDDVHIPSPTYSSGWLSIRSLWIAEKKVKLWAVILCSGARLNQLPLHPKIHYLWEESVGFLDFFLFFFKLLMEWPKCFSLRRYSWESLKRKGLSLFSHKNNWIAQQRGGQWCRHAPTGDTKAYSFAVQSGVTHQQFDSEAIINSHGYKHILWNPLSLLAVFLFIYGYLTGKIRCVGHVTYDNTTLSRQRVLLSNDR